MGAWQDRNGICCPPLKNDPDTPMHAGAVQCPSGLTALTATSNKPALRVNSRCTVHWRYRISRKLEGGK